MRPRTVEVRDGERGQEGPSGCSGTPAGSQPGDGALARLSSGAEFCQQPGWDWTQIVPHSLLGRARRPAPW